MKNKFGNFWCRNRNSYHPRSQEDHNSASMVEKHWIDIAIKHFGIEFVQGVKDVLNVGVLFITYPVFYALFEQLVSKGTRMSCFLLGS